MIPQNFVCASKDAASFENHIAAPIFRKSFIINSLEKCTLTIGCTGFYDLFLNGEKITDGYLKPYISNPDDIIFYNQYDLTNKLVLGENVICVILGNGHANAIGGALWGHYKRNHSAPAFALSCEHGDGSFSAEDMKWNRSHILFDDYRCGCFWDNTLFIKEWYLKDFDDSIWNAPVVCDYSHSVKKLASCESVDETRRIKPVKISKGCIRDFRMHDCFKDIVYSGETLLGKTPLADGYIYDFGENCSGVPCLKIKGERGQKIQMQFFECIYEGFADNVNINLYPESCCQKDVYICSGNGEEEFIPPFTFHGFRYCYVHGITEEQATEDLLTYVVLHNDIKIKAQFQCSDEISNQIFDACRRSDLANCFYIITDCPTREKNGWTGDVSLSAEHFMFNFAMENVLSDWLNCIRLAQNEAGELPVIVPSTGGFRKFAVWDSVICSIPYNVYKYTGNTQIIKDTADTIMKNLKMHLSLLDERGISEAGYGDWLPVDSEPDCYASPLGFCVSSILLLSLSMAQKMFDVVGMEENSKFIKENYDKLREAIRKEYNDNGVILKGRCEKYVKPTYRISQTSQALGLYCGIFNENEKDNAVKKLVELIVENNYSFDCGFLGLRAIFHVLSENGYSELAYKMITKPTHPSYANMIYRGETSCWERFQAPGNGIGSRNHHFLADVSSWYLKNVAGINVNPECDDPDVIFINPSFIKSIESASGSYENKNGSVEVKWMRNDDKIEGTINVNGNLKIVLADGLEDKFIICNKSNV